MENTDRILDDPDFHALTEIERLKVLYSTDPDYRRLHPHERWRVISDLLPPTPPQRSPTYD